MTLTTIRKPNIRRRFLTENRSQQIPLQKGNIPDRLFLHKGTGGEVPLMLHYRVVANLPLANYPPAKHTGAVVILE